MSSFSDSPPNIFISRGCGSMHLKLAQFLSSTKNEMLEQFFSTGIYGIITRNSLYIIQYWEYFGDHIECDKKPQGVSLNRQRTHLCVSRINKTMQCLLIMDKRHF